MLKPGLLESPERFLSDKVKVYQSDGSTAGRRCCNASELQGLTSAFRAVGAGAASTFGELMLLLLSLQL